MRFALLLLLALAGSAAADPVVWHRWHPPAACADADTNAIDSHADVYDSFPSCKVHVDWKRWHLVDVVIGGENTSVRGIVSVHRHGHRLVVKVATESVCMGIHRPVHWHRWLRVPATITDAVVEESRKPDPKPCLVP